MYKAKDYSYLFGMQGFSHKLIKNHITLYQGYVKNTNKIMAELNNIEDQGSNCFAELKRRFGWEFSGMRLHEYYFENLCYREVDKDHNRFFDWLCNAFGSFEQWRDDFTKVGLMRGIGWVILTRDNHTGRLFNCWVGEHDKGFLAGCQPLLVMDVWEHAYMIDYGLDRKGYIESFFNNINWITVMERFEHIGI